MVCLRVDERRKLRRIKHSAPKCCNAKIKRETSLLEIPLARLSFYTISLCSRILLYTHFTILNINSIDILNSISSFASQYRYSSSTLILRFLLLILMSSFTKITSFYKRACKFRELLFVENKIKTFGLLFPNDIHRFKTGCGSQQKLQLNGNR